MSEEELVLYESSDGSVLLPVQIEEDTVWLTQAQMVELFEKDQSVISRHINNALKEGEVDRKSNMQNLHIPSSDRPVTFYNLDVVISVGYRVKSQRGVEFRRWATGVLRRYIVEGQAVNSRRLEQLAGGAKSAYCPIGYSPYLRASKTNNSLRLCLALMFATEHRHWTADVWQS